MREPQNKTFPIKSTLNCGGKLLDLSTPKVMAILNVTPDSFYDGGKYSDIGQLISQAEKHINDGADIIDIGAVSTRPKSDMVPVAEELNRLIPAIKQIKDHFPDIIISADTFRASVAIEAAKAGATIINDISGGTIDSKMYQAVIDLQLPYVLMHIKGTPQTMQDNPAYDSAVDEVFKFLLDRSFQLKTMGAKDIILDLGYGFGKTLKHNYELLNGMQKFKNLGLPILAGLSRKSMINIVLDTKASEALNGTTALNMIALKNGARILRVHDAKEAVECIKLTGQIHLNS